MQKRRNLVLTGFMGTGKSAIGRRVARLANRPFLDMDAEIEQRAGKPIPRIFAEDGEPAFRDLESALAAEWGATREGAVIACGGGVVLRADNLRALGSHGLLVCLTARPEVILERTARSQKRPLLETADREKKIRDLLAARAPLYAQVPHQVETSDLDADTLATRLHAFWEQQP
jgi:shikimate kinase